MFCHKCGTEITSDDASFCSGCGEPLGNNQSPSQGRSPDSAFPDMNQESSPDNINLEFGDDEEPLKMSDPIDFLMQENEEEESPPESPGNTGSTDKFDALDNDALKNLAGDAGAGTPSENEPAERHYAAAAVDTMVQTRESDPPADEQEKTDGDTEEPPAEHEHQEYDQQQQSDSETGSDMVDQDSGSDTENTATESETPEDEQPQPPETETDPAGQDPDTNTEKMQTEQEPQENQKEDEQQQTETGTTDASTDTGLEKPPIAQEQPEHNKKEQPSEATAKADTSAVNNNTQLPPPLKVSPHQDFTKGENIVATAKIKVDEKNKNETDRMGNQESKFKSDISMFNRPKPGMDRNSLDISKIKRSSMIAYLSGNNLTFTGGPKISAGDEIKVGDSSYEVRLRPQDKNSLYMLIGSAVLAILVTLYFLGAFSSSDYGGLVGTVVSSGNRPLSEQQVRIKETGDKFTTNSAGFFIFDKVPVGIYTLEYIVDDEVVGEERITVLGGKISTVKISRSSGQSISSIKTVPATGRDSPATEKKTVSRNVRPSTPDKDDPGTVKLTLKPAGVRAYLDDKPMGVGSNSYNVRPGSYRLSVKKSGYQSQSKNIIVKAGKTNSYSFSLKEEYTPDVKTDGELASENETAGNYQEAQKYYEKMIAKDPNDVDAMLGIARCLKNRNMHESAMEYYTEAGRIAASKGDIEAQYEVYTAMIEMNPNNFTIYQNRGDLLYSSGDYSKAADDYLKVVTLDRHNLKTYYKLGNSYYKDGKYNDALDAYKDAEEMLFADPKAQYYLALTYYALDDHKNTEKAYKKFKELAGYSTSKEFEKDPEWGKVLEYLEVEN
jgi:tetratricopeptide (TPR) repeat protein